MIHSVSTGEIRIGDNSFDHTIALTTDTIIEDWTTNAVVSLTEDDFSLLLDDNLEFIVLGTGSSNIFAPRELVFAMARRGVGFEAMNTTAAARTFNVLANEGRQVAAVLYLPDE